MRFVLVELDTGEQEIFDTSYEGFKFAREQENRRRHSVEYLGVFDEDVAEVTVWCGQSLRVLLRSLDNLRAWILDGRTSLQDV
jgi:hypothetical protein